MAYCTREDMEAYGTLYRHVPGAASSDVPAERVEVELCILWGPRKLIGTGHGTLTSLQRAVIREHTRCDAATRTLWQTQMLTLYGPMANLKWAKAMADSFILDRAHRNHYNHEKRVNQHKFNKVYIYIYKQT